jgi:phosphoglycerate dehydrogenase-like enzyme
MRAIIRIDGRLAGVVPDVFDPEPLPTDNPLWTLPNVVMSPHTASLSVHENERIVGSSARNLRRLARDQELVSAVNLGEFY